MKKINYFIIFLCSFVSQTVSIYAMERQNCKSPHQILTENLLDMHIKLQIPISLIHQSTIISYPCYIYGERIEPNIQLNPQNSLYECPLCNRSFTQKKLILHIKATNIKPLYNVPLNGCDYAEIDDAYFLEWINQ